MQKYRYISNDIRSKILAGTYAASEQLPFERDLCVLYDASKMTVKKALDILVAEGLIIKRRGSGTFVKDLSPDEIKRITMANQFRGMTASNPGKEVKSKVLTFSVLEATPQVSNKLNLPLESLVYSIYRARYVEGQPRVMETIYMPVEQVPGLKKTHSEGSIYSYIEDELGLRIQSAHRQISIRKANETEVAYLELQPGDPVAVAEQIAYFDTGVAFEYSISVHPYNDFSVEMILTRD